MNKSNKKQLLFEKTNISVEFYIFTYENTFEPNEITKLLGIIPTESYIQKNKIDDIGPVKETSWNLIMNYEESNDINIQLDKLVQLLKPKKELLREIKQKYSAHIQFMIVIEVKNDEWPGMYLQNDFIKFVADIGGEIQFDPYYY